MLNICKWNTSLVSFFVALYCAQPLVAQDVLPLQRPQVALAQSAIHSACRIFGNQKSGTGFIVERLHEGEMETILVTANHVLDGIKSDKGKVVFRINSGESSGATSFSRQELELKVREAGKPIWTKHTDADVAVMKISIPKSVKYHAFKISNVANAKTIESGQLSVGQDCLIAGYPAQLESSKAGFAVLRKGMVSSYPIGPVSKHSSFLVDYRSFGGDSGGPVVSRLVDENGKDTFVVLGLVFGQHRQTDKSITPFAERIEHTSLGLGMVAHGQFIHEAIELLDR